MGSIQGQPDERDLRYLKLVTGRLQIQAENDIAAGAGCDSPAELYQRLASDGFPVCGTCGATHVSADHCSKENERSRRAHSPGTVQELPPSAAAADLFREKLNNLLRAVENLERRRESYQGRRYAGTDVRTGTMNLSRESLTDEDWQELCKKYSLDSEGLLDTNTFTRVPVGASREPTEPLTTLIGVYALAGGDVNMLLKALHPGEPPAEALESMRKCVEGEKKPDKKEGLKAVTRQLAILVRGGATQGAPPDSLGQMDHNVACMITQHREDGWSEERINQEIEQLGYTRKRIAELGNLRLRWPKR